MVSDYLEDAREERFCEYVGTQGRDFPSSYQRAFRVDCGLVELNWTVLCKVAQELGERDYIKARINQIRAFVGKRGKLTKELLTLRIEEKLGEILDAEAVDSKDRYNLARSTVVFADSLRKLKGWDRDEQGSGITVTMNRVFPKGFVPKGDDGVEETTKIRVSFDEVADKESNEEYKLGTKTVSKAGKGGSVGRKGGRGGKKK